MMPLAHREETALAEEKKQGAPVSDAESLAHVPLFAGLTEGALEQLAAHAYFREYHRGEMVLQQGGTNDWFFVIVKGAAKVCNVDEEGREVILSILEKGDFFGEMGILDENPRSASVMALESSTMLLLSRSDFLAFLKTHFDATMHLIRVLVGRLRIADRKIESLALLDVYGRVARALMDLSAPQEGTERVIERRVTRQDIARMVGASREMVSRVMKDLEARGSIDTRDGRIVICNVDDEAS